MIENSTKQHEIIYGDTNKHSISQNEIKQRILLKKKDNNTTCNNNK